MSELNVAAERWKKAKELLPMILTGLREFGCVISIGLHAPPLTGFCATIFNGGEAVSNRRSWCEAGHGHTMEEAIYNAWMMKIGQEKYIPAEEFEDENLV